MQNTQNKINASKNISLTDHFPALNSIINNIN